MDLYLHFSHGPSLFLGETTLTAMDLFGRDAGANRRGRCLLHQRNAREGGLHAAREPKFGHHMKMAHVLFETRGVLSSPQVQRAALPSGGP
jgi:hypothetical protein